jgi:hypothetical protein
LLNGVIADGQQVHHLCENLNCIYPEHLVALGRADHDRLHRYAKRHLQ